MIHSMYSVLTPLLACAVALGSGATAPGQARAPHAGAIGVPAFETLTRTMPDKVELTIDLYRHPEGDDGGKPRPVLVCFHASQGSRAEYRPIAGRLLELGVHVVAVDLRHGGVGEKWDRVAKKRHGTPNGTWLSAQKVTGRVLPQRIECYADMDFAVRWARELFPSSPVGLVGSSFSATLVLGYAAEHPRDVDAVLALSPSDRYIPEWDVAARLKDLVVPAYVTCGQLDKETNAARRLLRAMPEHVETVLPEPSEMAAHGARTLSEAEPKLRRRQWKLVESMVERLFRVRKRTKEDARLPETADPTETPF